jgi:HNH endonuclease
MPQRVETVVFEGRTFYRYPDSDRPTHRRYFQRPGISLHRAVWEHHHGVVPEGHEIHHRDEDTLNNDISNLEAVPLSVHRRQAQARRVLHDLLCCVCGASFRAYGNQAAVRRFCSRTCKARFHNARYRERQRGEKAGGRLGEDWRPLCFWKEDAATSRSESRA